MSSEIPLVTILLPFFNSEKTLAAAIQSIVNQTLKDWELILIDDCSNDASANIARGFSDPRIRLLTNVSNVGLAGSLNMGVVTASAPYIARMDADDISYPERLATQLQFLEQHLDVDVVGASILMFKGNGVPVKLLRPPLSGAEIKLGWIKGSFPLYHPTWMAKSTWFRKFLYDPNFSKGQDHELLLRALKSSTYANTSETLLGYRNEAGNIGKSLLTRGYVLSAQKKNLLMRGKLLNFCLAAAITIAKCITDLLRWQSRSPLKSSSNGHGISCDDLARWHMVYDEVNR
jgi:glycosyltransferase involved in cell wall biosynthesis